ncbi:nucleotide sugar dehydrogenase [Streptomyces cellulosae]|jgi:UDP-N-acetyl-D-glucosamine dehydrogenase|uniref:Nucleotide sugar dehydrogenase n=3 Tax=Streptomyces TaxID=1883 RepID=A0ABU3JDC6_9ACTN|nr:nucleotide sugar dehydrogenase [Streptomyces sp. McG7]MBT2905290.1 nucleotide sugar dehydrogenase [Streptomyces sp. McG8]MCP8706720.1 nucleotide sugar dehydrogenase [Streptomyces sp. AC04842]MCX4478836.1 nucleotide sugar dehydrogenase [Streptomyces cellulosae]MDN3285260.1 nucleotide sugar dehydrogenase [Streptomyces thermocarboxydus]MDQ0489128.1 nucleotide sugar dehydrogenase [Streptomyces thermodiastaticus]MDX3412802.1 nucleotide sugar dehydrogenase [Streptomyces sp. MD20-1-1]MXQ56250.1 
MPADLAVIGLGPFGLPLAQAAVAAGIPTVGYRTGPEPGSLSPAEQRRMLAQGFRVTTSAAELGRVRTAVICAPTAPAADGGLDLGQVEAAARTLAAQLRPHTTVILESPVPPGTTEGPLLRLLESGSGLRAGRDFHLAHCPSRVDPGNRDFTPANTPKVIGGLTPACTESAAAFYGRITDKVVRARGPREAETVQLLETNFRHVNIALVNEMAALCHDLGIDLWDVLRCAETKPFGFLAFRPGPGVGGHTVPQDLTAHAGRTLRMAELAQEVNGRMPRYVVQRAAALLNEHGKSARGARVLLLGVTYKADLADLQGSPAQEIAVRLMELGASVSYHDPHVPSWNVLDRPVPRADSLYEAAADADLTILLQQHRTYDLQGLSVKAQLLLDTRGATPTGAAHRL